MMRHANVAGTVLARPRWMWRGSHAQRAVVLSLAVTIAVAVLADRWYARRLESRARAQVQLLGAMKSDELVRSAARETSILGAVASFVESRRSPAELDREFPVFVDGVRADPSIATFILIRRGRVVGDWPRGASGLLGADLGESASDSSASAPAAAVMRPFRSERGGLILVVHRRLAPREGFPDRAGIVFDLREQVARGGIPGSPDGVRYELYDRGGVWVGGDPQGSAIEPETLRVAAGNGAFTMLAAPAQGWVAMNGGWQGAARGVLALSVLAITTLAWLIGRRRDDLETEVRHSGTALDLVMRSSRMGGWEEDLTQGTVRWNATIDAILGYPGDAGAGGMARLAAAIVPEDRERLASGIARARGSDATGFLEEVRIRGAGGEVRWVLVLGDVVRDASGRPSRIVGVVADATERHRLQERLRHAQRLEALGRIAGGVAHDFNELLMVVLAYGELAAARAGDLPAAEGAVVREDLEQLVISAKRGAALTQQLRTFSQEQDAPRAPLDVGVALHALLPTLSRLCPAPVRVEARIGASLPKVRIDEGHLGQVLTNLVVNARDAMPEGGLVQVRATHVDARATDRLGAPAEGEWVVVEVADTGAGMSAEVRERIFEPYFTTKPTGRGTGLGLAVVYGIVESAGGGVTVDSVEGRGTTFRIHLPRHPESA